MWIGLLGFVLFGSAIARDLPTPHLNKLSSGGVEISIKDAPGIKFRDIKYTIGGEQYTGPFHLAVDGRWYHRNDNVNVHKNGPIHYKLVAIKNGEPVIRNDVFTNEETSAMVLPPQSADRLKRGSVVMRDDFNGASVNRGHWDYEVSMYGGYNWEIQVYTSDSANIFTRNGKLYVKPTLTSDKYGEAYLHSGTMDVAKLWGACTNADRYGCVRHGRDGLLPPIMSGKLKSKATIRYGRVEVRAKIPRGDWIWPAIWMLPRSSVYGAWPRSGEIDMMESRGNTVAHGGDGVNHGVQEVLSTLHWGSDASHNRYSWTTHGAQNSAYWSSGFHTYILDWTKDHIMIYVDSKLILNVPTPSEGFWNHGNFPGSNIWSHSHSAPFDQAFYLILNVAIGGTNGFFPDGWTYGSPKPWNNNSPTEGADFWNARSHWLPTWNGDDVAMQVESVVMTQY